MTPETEALIARVRELDAKATPGPMKVVTGNTPLGDTGDFEGYAQIEAVGHRESDPVVCEIWNPEDDDVALLEAFAHYRTAAPFLATALEAAEKRADAAEAMHAASCATSREYWQRLEAAEAKLKVAREALEKADSIIKRFTGDRRSHCVIERALTQLEP